MLADEVALMAKLHRVGSNRRAPTWGSRSAQFGEDQHRLEAVTAACNRGKQSQAAANLFHDVVYNGEAETAASTY